MLIRQRTWGTGVCSISCSDLSPSSWLEPRGFAEKGGQCPQQWLLALHGRRALACTNWLGQKPTLAGCRLLQWLGVSQCLLCLCLSTQHRLMSKGLTRSSLGSAPTSGTGGVGKGTSQRLACLLALFLTQQATASDARCS